MNLPLDDAQLTAFALGELSDAERAAVERELAASPEMRAHVEETQTLARSLRAEFAEELRAAATPAANVIPLPMRDDPWTPGWRLAIAAILATAAVVAALALSSSGSLSGRSEVARNGKNASPRETTFYADVTAEPGSAAQSAATSLPLSTPITLSDTELSPGRSGNYAGRVQTESGKSPAIALAQATPALSATGEKHRFRGMVIEGSYGNTNLGASNDGASRGQDFATLGPAVPAEQAAPQFAHAFTEKAKRVAGGDRTSSIGGSPMLASNGDDRTDIVVYAQSYDRSSLFEKENGSRASKQDLNTAAYDHIAENPFLAATQNPLSTFSIDVDTASYANVRRFIHQGSLPPKDAVRVEELINYFTYDYPQPEEDVPFSINLDGASCPWNAEHRLVRIGLKGREIANDKRGASNLVFLLDVSGSMNPAERLPLIKQSMRLLVEKLTENDRVAIVIYAGGSGVALPSTPGSQKEKIFAALEELKAGGSTNGAEGIGLAYKVAAENFIKGGVNRVILATDGDFNVGTTSQGELVRLIEAKAKTGVFLSVLGVGTDNLKDSMMQKLADKGNGNYAYLDSLEEARKVLVQQMNGTLVTIAKDVKIQVEFNPARVAAYRLIGYEKRLLRKEDFNNDKIDAGEIGAGHTVTALYEITPAGVSANSATSVPPVDPLKYTPTEKSAAPGGSAETLTVKLRYKKPDGDKSELVERTFTDAGAKFENAAGDFKFAAAAAEFGMVLRESDYRGNGTLGAVLEWAEEGKGADANGYRSGFLQLVRKAQALKVHEG